MKKMFLCLGVIIILSAEMVIPSYSQYCEHDTYKVRVEATHIDNTIDIIIIETTNINNFIIKNKKFMEKCTYCNNSSDEHVYLYNVKYAKITKIYKKSEPMITNKGLVKFYFLRRALDF